MMVTFGAFGCSKTLNRDMTRVCGKCGTVVSKDTTGGLCPKCLLESGLDLLEEESEPARTADLPSRQFGDYELLEEIAHGGMGVVYKARQRSLNRIVALKLLLYGRFSSEEFVKRFRAEAAAAASLQHPNIVAIHDVGEHEGQPFFSMDYVEGRSLAEVAKEGPVSPERAARYLQAIADAIHYAHQHAILHRDLKPSNVLIDVFDRPRLTDFGLAKDLQADSELTMTGQVLGSPNFMPPEQVLGRHGQMGPPSDVYSLGAMLYHLLTGRPPFQGATAQQVLLQVQNAEPVPPRRLNPGIPIDLETICLQCLEKEPSRRYSTAEEVSDELNCFLRDEPIRARPISVVGRLWRWSQRQPLVAGLVLTVAALLAAVTIGSTVAAIRLKQAERVSIQKLWESYLAQARAERFRPEVGRRASSLEAIAKAARLQPSLELRNEAIASLVVSDLRVANTWTESAKDSSPMIRFDPKLETYAEPTAEGDIRIRRVEDNSHIALLPCGLLPRWVYSFSPNGRYLALLPQRADKCVWDVHRQTLVLSNLPSTEIPVAFSPTQAVAANVDSTGSIVLYDIESGAELRRLKGASGRNGPLEFHPRLQQLACFNADRRTVDVVDLESEKILLSVPVPDQCVVLAWSSDGSLLAAGCHDGSLHVWNATSAENVAGFEGHDGHITALTFNHAGDLLATASWDGTARLWAVASGKELITFAGSSYFLNFSPDDRRLAPILSGNRFSVLELSHTAAYRCYKSGSRTDKGRSLAISGDGRWFATGVRDGLHFWDASSGQRLGMVPFSDARSIVIPNDSKSIIAAGQDGLRRWPVGLAETTDGFELRLGAPESLRPAGRTLTGASLTADGRFVALADVSVPGARIVDLEQRTTTLKLSPHPRVQAVAISPDGRWVATAPWSARGVKIWDTLTTNEIKEIPTTSGAHLLFSPDGRWLVIGSGDYQLWEVPSWRRGPPVPINKPNHLVGVMALSPDSKLLAAVEGGTSIKLIECGTTNVIANLEPPDVQMLASLCFSHDGRQLLALDARHNIHFWDLPALRNELASLGLDWSDVNGSTIQRFSNSTTLRPLRLAFAFSPGRGPKKDILPRDANCNAAQIDLSAHYTSALEESWFVYYENDSLASLPHGLQALAGIKFDLRGLVQLQGEPETDGRFPERVTNIRVDQPCRRLHFLQATHRHPAAGREIGDYVVHFSNGSEIRLPLVYGYNTMDWWAHSKDRKEHPAMEIAWTGTNPAAAASKTDIRLFKWTWENPLPDLEVASIDFVSALNGCAPFLVAVTAE